MSMLEENSKNLSYDSFENEKERYIAVLKNEQFSNEPVKNHAIFIEHYKTMFPERKISQSTVSENFNTYNILKNEDGVYEYIKPIKDTEKILTYFLAENSSRITKVSQNEYYTFKINAEIGTEQILAKAIYDYLRDPFKVTIIPCVGAIQISAKSEKYIQSLHDKLKSLM